MNKKHSHFWLRLFETILLIIAFFVAAFLVFAGTEQRWRKPDVEVQILSPAEISPSDSVKIKFNRQVDPSKIENKLVLSPSVKVSRQWKSDNSELEIKPVAYFTPGERYTLAVSIPRGIFKNKYEERKFEFQVLDYPKVESIVPSKEEMISVNSNIEIAFDSPANDFNINFLINPSGEFKWESDNEKKQFHIISKDKLQYDTTYWIRIIIEPVSNSGEGEKKEIFYGQFQTEKKPVIAATHDNSAIIPQDQVVDQNARINSGKYIDINLAKQHLSTFEDSQRLGTYRISTGKRGMATPTGNFKILSKRERAWSNKYKLYMPYWMQFTGAGHGIHELPEWPGGYKEGAAHLGIPVSHGCIRLGIGPAATVYAWADIGTPVVIHY